MLGVLGGPEGHSVPVRPLINWSHDITRWLQHWHPSLPPDLVVMEFMLQPGRDNTTIVCLQAQLPHSLKACRKESAREFVATVLPPLTYTESKVAP